MSFKTQPTRKEAELAVVAALVLPESDAAEAVDPLAEIRSLAEAAGARVVDSICQRRARPNPRAAFGKGKIEEIRLLCRQLGATLLIVDFDLSPSQGRNLEEDIGVRVVDRTELILDIFASRASTRQAHLQVELAQLQYMKSRLRRMWTHLERTEAAIGTRGPGETQLESDRRMIDHKIVDLRRRLAQIERRSHRQAVQRLDPNTVSLVGYTNAGKSSLMTALSGAEVLVADQLFATLDTRVRNWHLRDRRLVMLADTVGFVRDLPHHLVASFHATLEETLNADLLLHVCDASDPDLEIHLRAVKKVLADLGAVDIPSLLVLNKADLLSPDDRLALTAQFPNGLLLSAHSKEGFESLDQAIAAQLDRWSLHLDLQVPAGAGRLLADLQRLAAIDSADFHGAHWHARLRLSARHWSRLCPELRQQGGTFRSIPGNGHLEDADLMGGATRSDDRIQGSLGGE